MKLILYAILDCLVRTSSSNDVQFASHVFPCSLKMFKNSTQKLLWLWNTVESHLDAANWSSPYCPWTSPSHTASKQLGDTFVNFSGLGSHRPIHFCRVLQPREISGFHRHTLARQGGSFGPCLPRSFFWSMIRSCCYPVKEGFTRQFQMGGWELLETCWILLTIYIWILYIYEYYIYEYYIYMNIIYIYVNIIYMSI